MERAIVAAVRLDRKQRNITAPGVANQGQMLSSCRSIAEPV